LQAACFAHLSYEDVNSGVCFSNLLAVGFRRFELDLYWDQGRDVWSFCPIAIPTSIPDTIPAAGSSILSLSTLAALTSGTVPTASSGSPLNARQNTDPGTSSSSVLVGSGLPSPSRTLSSSSPTLLGNSSPSIVVVPDNFNDPLVHVGPYICSTTINLSTFTSQILSYIEQTENTLDARLLQINLNVHAAASDKSPLSSAPEPTNLPGPSNSLSGLFSGNLSAFLYTPSNLASDRANLNSSWYTVQTRYRPVENYYNITLSQYNVASTEDGWPAESFVEFSKSKRLLIGWGTVDPQMAGYNFSGDTGTIFPSDYIQDFQTDVTADASGDLTRGCFMRNSTDDLGQVNASWAVASTIPGFEYPITPTADIVPLLNLTTNSTNCGISSILNVTLLNATAHDNFHSYRNYTAATIWSWAQGEPRNYTGDSDASSDSLFRCATANIDLAGRWVVADCSQKYYAACRAKQPYNWSITTYPISYSFAKQACNEPYQFAAPRTALENSYLTQKLRDSRRDYDGQGVWVDFNSLDYKSCWVTGGPNATCPYSDTLQQDDDLEKRVILVCSISFQYSRLLTNEVIGPDHSCGHCISHYCPYCICEGSGE